MILLESVNANNNIIPIEEVSKKIIKYTSEADTAEDYQKARKAMHDLLELGQTAFEKSIDIAEDSEHPRAFEVASGLLKNLGEIAEKLLQTQKNIREIEFMDQMPVPGSEPKSNNEVVPATITQFNVEKIEFTGTSAQFFDKMEEELGVIDVESELVSTANNIPQAE